MSPVHGIQIALILAVTMGALSRLRAMRRTPEDIAVKALFFALVNIDISLILGLPEPFWTIYRLLGEIPGMVRLFTHASVMGMAYCLQIFTMHLASPDLTTSDLDKGRRLRRRWLLAGLGALVVCYLVGPLRTGHPFIPFGGERDPGVAAYVSVIQLYCCVALTDALRLCWRNRNITLKALRVGLRLLAGGMAFGILFCLHKVAYFVAVAFGAKPSWQESGTAGIQLLFLGPALLLSTGGLMAPRLLPRVERWRSRRRAYRRLVPLVSAIQAADPNSAIVEHAHLRGRDARLLNQVITIRDSLLGPLRSRLDQRVYEIAYDQASRAGLCHEDARATAEAACILGALSSEGEAHNPLAPTSFAHHSDLESEANWLARVSAAFAASAPVRASGSRHARRNPGTAGRA
ncbi:hypothetical protein Rhe02_86350 [Rhizocola hellebori]|uniref:DUF6545 domain-containing protein n=1 Tax=Rhizocola hellebori TaxID=1392758 RepID=A0A8J3QJL3_9ACTN|nr:MAB_1171c family putative transporter [Rhizocola hellebori]GIH10568.1 hypothetical protein Rhe02_86350 [Rhizocola hellebori]